LSLHVRAGERERTFTRTKERGLRGAKNKGGSKLEASAELNEQSHCLDTPDASFLRVSVSAHHYVSIFTHMQQERDTEKRAHAVNCRMP